MTADEIIEALALEPHPEGGWYRETWRASSESGARASSTAIHFLLRSNEKSHWHRVDADEIWLWQAGDALRLMQAAPNGTRSKSILLGPPDMRDHCLQSVIPAGHWQAAEPQPEGAMGYVLVSCVVAPGFDFAGFELAPDGWQPGDSGCD